MHACMMKHRSSAERHSRYSVTENNEGIKGLRELVMKAFRSLDDYKDFKAARVTGCLGGFRSNPGQNLSCVYLYIYSIIVLMWWCFLFFF